MHYRLASILDYRELADLHIQCSRKQQKGFMYNLGVVFFRQYYKVFLAEKSAVILCVVADNGRIIGFNSGTLKAEEHALALRRNAIRLGLAVVLAMRPGLIRECIVRFKSLLKGSRISEYGIREGPRGDYWAWDPADKNPAAAIELHKRFRDIMGNLGATCVRSEVDFDNKVALRSQLLLGGKIVYQFVTPDGRDRCIIEFTLKEKD